MRQAWLVHLPKEREVSNLPLQQWTALAEEQGNVARQAGTPSDGLQRTEARANIFHNETLKFQQRNDIVTPLLINRQMGTRQTVMPLNAPQGF